MVTSLRPRSSSIKDDSVLTTDRFRDANRFMQDRKRARRQFGMASLKVFIREQIDFLEHMDREIVEADKVQKGVFDDSHLCSEELKQQWHKKQPRAAIE
ncbi:unnamed protein product [Penicillium palitans]